MSKFWSSSPCQTQIQSCKQILPIYFTIQLIFTTIHESHRVFSTIYEFYCTILSTVLSIKKFQFQQNKQIPNEALSLLLTIFVII